MSDNFEQQFHPCDCAKSGGAFPTCSEWWRLRRSGTKEEGLEAARAHFLEAYGAAVRASRETSEVNDWRAQLRRMGVPDEATRKLEAPQDNALMLAARKFIGSPREVVPALTFLGETGLGKTVAAAFVLKDFAKRWDWNASATGETTPPAMFVPARQFTGLSSFDAGDQRIFGWARRTKVLVVDDLGDEATDYAKGQVVDVLMERLDANRRTVVTSNLLPDKFPLRYGGPLFDRLKSRGLLPKIHGQSMRRRAP